MIHTFAVSICSIAGVILIYASIFLKESEEGIVQNRLEVWLEMIRLRREKSLSYVVALMNAVAVFTGRIFDKLFGKKLFSIRSFGASMCYSLGSIVVFRDVIGIPFMDYFVLWMPFTLAWLVLFYQLATMPDVISSKLALRFWFTSICIAIVGMMFLGEQSELSRWGEGFNVFSQRTSWGTVAESVSSPLLVLFGSFVCDIFFIVFTRWMLKRIAATTRIDKILFLLLLNFAACIMLIGPGFIDTTLVKPQLRFWVATQLKLLGQFNFLDAVVGGLFVLILSGVFLHRLLWPFLERPLYSLHRFGVIKNKKLLWTLGTVLLIGPAADVSFAKWIIDKVSKAG
jgi:hypothetical protein